MSYIIWNINLSSSEMALIYKFTLDENHYDFLALGYQAHHDRQLF